MESLGDREMTRLLEENAYPARLVRSGLVWVELDVIDPSAGTVNRRRMSKSAFADLILDWRISILQTNRHLARSLQRMRIAA